MTRLLLTHTSAVLFCISMSAGFAAVSEANETVAMVNGVPVTQAEFRKLLGNRLIKVQSEEYRIANDTLDEYLDNLVLAKEAQSEGISPAELISRVVDQPPSPDPGAVAAAWQREKAVYADLSESVGMQIVAERLANKRKAEVKAEFLTRLRKKYGVAVFLKPPRAAFPSAEEFPRGAGNPVKIIEFSDFECPYCGNLQATLRQLEELYPDKIELSFRHFPLPAHKDAQKASEAALCAGEQQKFWEMHDLLYANQRRLTVTELQRYAGDLKLDQVAFDECLNSGRTARVWQADRELGMVSGITGTPTIFINGRMITGAVPLLTLSRIVQEELANAEQH